MVRKIINSRAGKIAIVFIVYFNLWGLAMLGTSFYLSSIKNISITAYAGVFLVIGSLITFFASIVLVTETYAIVQKKGE